MTRVTDEDFPFDEIRDDVIDGNGDFFDSIDAGFELD
jgi:hypothetical protein